MSDKEKDVITIRTTSEKFDRGGELVAFIWNAEANSGNVMSYMTVGQHSEASIEFHDDGTRGLRYIKEIEDAQVLIAELRNLGYNI